MSQDNNNSNNNNDSGTLAKDSQGNVNISRGIIGLKSNPSAPTITEGTVADKVNQPSRFPNAEGRVNPVTAEDLDKRIQLERSKAGFDKYTQDQIAVKARTEAQGFKYTPPEEFKDNPELAPTPDNFQEGEPVVNESQGEQVIDMNNNNNNNQQNQNQQ